jgi:hypothetical protein
LRVGLEGKIASIKERRPGLIAESETRIRNAARVVAKLQKRAPDSYKLHQKKRRLVTSQARLRSLQADHDAGAMRLCFGAKKLFHAKFDLAANGYADHAAWKADWQRARSDQCFVLGSQDETAGNQNCQATVGEDGSLRLEVIEVSPAYTSVIGAVTHAQQRGISVHQGAATAIARRGLGLSERPAVREAIVPIRNGDHVTFDLSVRNRSKHVWSFWSNVRTRLTAAHVAHFRSGAAKAAPAPLRQSNPASCPIWISTAKTPWRESLSALFGERHGGCSVVMERLSMALGTVRKRTV